MTEDEFVRFRLSLAQLELSDEDVRELVAAVPGVQRWERVLLTLVERDAMPDLRFDPSTPGS